MRLEEYLNKLEEDKKEREERRSERREERREGKFQGDQSEYETGEGASSAGEFKIKPFMRALDTMKNQIIGKLLEIDSILGNPSAKGKKVAEKYKRDYVRYLDRTAQIMGQVDSFKKGEGKEFEEGDETLKAGFRNLYNELSKDLVKTNEKYVADLQESVIRELSELKYKDVNDLIIDAKNSFTQAQNDINLFIEKQKQSEMSKKSSEKGQEKAISGQIKIEAPIKKWVKGKPANETVKKVQQLIFDKFKNVKEVSDTELFKKFIRPPFPDGKNGNTTSQLIIRLKFAFGLKDESSDITQEFIDQLNSMKESVTSKLIDFESFLNKLPENFDPAKWKESEKKVKPLVPKKTEPVDKKGIVKELEKNKPDTSVKIKEESIQQMMDRLKKEAKREFTIEELIKDLKKIQGVEIAEDFDSSKKYSLDPKNPRKGYLAKCKGLYFFENGVCVRSYDGQIGYYNPETGYYKGKDGWKEKIEDLIKKGGVPKKYTYLTKMLIDALNDKDISDYDARYIDFWKNKLSNYGKSTLKAIFNTVKWKYKDRDLLSDLRGLRKRHDYIKDFYDKNKDLLKELV